MSNVTIPKTEYDAMLAKIAMLEKALNHYLEVQIKAANTQNENKG